MLLQLDQWRQGSAIEIQALCEKKGTIPTLGEF